MGAELLAAGIGALGSIASSLLTNASNQGLNAENFAYHTALNQQNFEYQKQLQDRSADLTSYLMDFENQYNTPSQQMKRLLDAGLNPYALMNNPGTIGSGNSQGSRGVSPGSVSPSSFNMIPNQAPDVGGAAATLFSASQIRSQRIAALSEMAKSIPSLVKGVGSDTATRILSSIFGRDVDTELVNDVVKNEALQTQYQTEVNHIQSVIASKFGEKEASNRVALQEEQFNKMAAEIGLMASEGKLNEEKIRNLMSEYVRNLADAWKLKREGDYYVASAETINALRGLTVASLQNEVTKSGFENRIKGYFEGSGLDNYLSGSYHSKKTGDVLRIQENKTGSELVQAMDLVFGKWLKVSAAP